MFTFFNIFNRANAVVYYDDPFNGFHTNPKKFVYAVMELVNQMFLEPHLTPGTKLQINTVATEHLVGENWGVHKWNL